MAQIMEENKHESEVFLSVLRRRQDEQYRPWKIIELEVDGYERMTPLELRNLGKWLISESKRIGRTYTASGSLRKKE